MINAFCGMGGQLHLGNHWEECVGHFRCTVSVGTFNMVSVDKALLGKKKIYLGCVVLFAGLRNLGTLF